MLAEHSDDPALQSFVSSELAAQARSNPGVMDRLDGLVPAAVAGAGAFAMTGWAG
jgi:hypothetical protein